MTTEIQIVKPIFIIMNVRAFYESGIYPINKNGTVYLHFETFALN